MFETKRNSPYTFYMILEKDVEEYVQNYFHMFPQGLGFESVGGMKVFDLVLSLVC